MKYSIAIIIACHNRKKKTLLCLSLIEKQINIDNCDITIYITDDGSIDGTADEILLNFPQVKLLQGNGSLYWNGGMRLAFGEAIKKNYNYYLWLNDDVQLNHNAIEKLINTSLKLQKTDKKPSIIIGSVKDPITGDLTYGGNRKKSCFFPLSYKRIQPEEKPIECDAINGNCVLIPNLIAEKVGNLSPEFTHGGGDYDYSLRAKKKGFKIYIGPGFFGTCEKNSLLGSCKDRSLSIDERQDIYNRPTAIPPAKEWMLYARRHAGIFWPIYWARTWLRVLFPKLWLIVRSKKSK